MSTKKKGAGQPSAGLRAEYRMLRKGETVRPTDEYESKHGWKACGYLFPNLPMLMPNYDPETMLPIRRRIRSPKGSAKRGARSRPKSSSPQSSPRKRRAGT